MWRMPGEMTPWLGAVLAAAMVADDALGGFEAAGYDLRVVQSDQGLPNAAVSFQTNRTWIGTVPEKPYTFGTSFTLPALDQVLYARLYMNLWGGTNAYTCQVDAVVNSAPLAPVQIGGTGDANPVYQSSATSVYGSGFGTWQVACAGTAGLLHADGTPNTVEVTVTDPNDDFDGRTVDVTLAVVYRSAALHPLTALDYYLLEGDGYLRKSPHASAPAPAERTATVAGIDVAGVLGASYTAHYTHGDAGQKDGLYFNGTPLGGSDVAVAAMGMYGPDVLTFDVAALLAPTSTLRYSVSEAVVGGPAETSVFAKIGLLEVTHPVPEPATLGAVLAGGALLLARRRSARPG